MKRGGVRCLPVSWFQRECLSGVTQTEVSENILAGRGVFADFLCCREACPGVEIDGALQGQKRGRGLMASGDDGGKESAQHISASATGEGRRGKWLNSGLSAGMHQGTGIFEDQCAPESVIQCLKRGQRILCDLLCRAVQKPGGFSGVRREKR